MVVQEAFDSDRYKNRNFRGQWSGPQKRHSRHTILKGKSLELDSLALETEEIRHESSSFH